jgi:preprotein translocase subunit SecA
VTKLFSKIFNPLKKYEREVQNVNELESWATSLSDSEIKAESEALKQSIRATSEWEEQKGKLDEVLPKAFALVREVAKRTLKQRHYDVQLIGGMVLHRAGIAEMATGEGKTLASTTAVYLNALAGRGAHVITVNEYLAKRDAVWMGQIYEALGMSVSCLIHDQALLYDPAYRISEEQQKKLDEERDRTGSFMVHDEFLRPISRKEAYQAEITYGTNHEFGFDYLRDNLAYSTENQVQRGRRHFAVIDEVDSILVDEARTPLIISAPDTESSEFYKTFARVVRGLNESEDYIVDEKYRSADITEAGINNVEKAIGVQNIFAPENLRLTHYLQESLRAAGLYKRDREYVVQDGKVFIIDQSTGRVLHGRRYNGGLHQAIEAKEGVKVEAESRTYAKISVQNYFRLYTKLSGMTGTAQTSAEEFDKVYGLEVATIPTNKPIVRDDMADMVYKTAAGKHQAIMNEIKERQAKGQPMLVGTISIQKNEELSKVLFKNGIQHEILNAKNHEREGMIIAQAGRAGAVTVATNMAGRGVDIVLGGNPSDEGQAKKVCEAGGLHVIGTERHDSRRIDNQLRGRSGRQGDPGSSQFFLSLEDDLMRVFGGDRVKSMMETLRVPEDMPIQSKIVSRAVSQSQSRVEGFNFDARKHLLEYDDVLNKQRTAIYKRRQEMIEGGEHPQIIGALDALWMQHLNDIEALQESVRLRAYGQRDPLVEFRKEGYEIYQAMMTKFEAWIAEHRPKIEEAKQSREEAQRAAGINPAKLEEHHAHAASFGNRAVSKPAKAPDGKKIGRNDPCYCGAKKPDGTSVKYKHCHGK